MRKSIDIEFVRRFGENLRRIRKSKNCSMEQLAHKSNMEYSQISRIERGQINTSISTAKVLADALEVEVHQLFNFSN
ncbi:helix-turn-helix domain-containing protein [Leeuwenhoekiella parthenopeia]|uniref:Helix-turn-helix domain-containing protein n=1 Tax=Leeuwenhoekiella parthenopeia TaxID=2890320 RepID=A0ABS8GVU4_9FLAO|nr:helix-turn-helix domain-containing protein [Leeuwenhoekiella parthenopeia]